jgi:hypothetical protein
VNAAVRTATAYFTIGHEDDQLRTQRVQIIDGYSTEADIPKIIACRRTGNPEDAVFVNVQSVEYDK